MELRTPIKIIPSPHSIQWGHSLLSIGSCFAEVMGERLRDHKFRVEVNPFGVIFNPLSIAKLLKLALNGKALDADNLVQTSEGWRHYDLHSGHWGHSPEALLAQGNQLLQNIQLILQQADWLLLTLGTAFAYRRKENGQWVANCHKVPATYFAKELLTVEVITSELDQLLEQLFAANPSLRVVLTVSPIRHTKDTLTSNSVSKSVLRVAAHELTEKFPQVAYFPAYEIMLDDLRDYRFYQADMIHPSPVAEDYIWEQFSLAYFSDRTRQSVQEWHKLRQALAHRPLHPGTASHKAFLRQLQQRLQTFTPAIDVSQELQQIEQQLTAFG